MTTINVPQPRIYHKEDGIYYVDDTLVNKRAQVHELHLGPVALQDGTVLAQSDIASAYFLFIRYDFESSKEVEKIWSTSNKKWDLPANIPDEDRDKNVLLFTDDATYPWKGPFVLIAEEGKFESPPIHKGYPKYTLQCYFTSRMLDEKTYTGNSIPAVRITMGTFPPHFDARLEIYPEDDTDSEYIQVIHDDVGLIKITRSPGEILILHDHGAQVRFDNLGNISLTTSGGGKVDVTGDVDITGAVNISGYVRLISQYSGAQIRLDSSGNISLTPSSGGKVNVTGDVDITGAVNISDFLTVNEHKII